MPDTTPLLDGVDQTHVRFDEYDTVVPLRYQSGTAMVGLFPARTRALVAKAPHPSLRPATIAPGISLVAVIGFEFVTDIGPVNELCIAVPLRGGMPPIPLLPTVADTVRGTMPSWIWHLPVSSAIANVHGRQIWGFPKIHATIDVTEDGDGNQTAFLGEGDTPILSLHGPVLEGKRTLTLPLVNYLWQDDSHVQTADHEFRLSGVGFDLRPGAARLELLSDHPIARDLDDVLLGRRALAYVHARNLEALLGMPQVLTPALLERLRIAAEAYDEHNAVVSA